MIRISAIFIAICMVVIAASLGGVLFLALKVSAVMSAFAALAALTCMALYSSVANRLRDRRIVGDQIADLSRGTADLARQVAELNRRIGAIENRGERTRSVADPVAAEISELGTLVKQLAETVAAHESEIYRKLAVDQNTPAVVPASSSLNAECSARTASVSFSPGTSTVMEMEEVETPCTSTPASSSAR